RSSDPAASWAAFKTLRTATAPEAVEFLLAELETGDLQTQILAVQALGQLRAASTAPHLLELLRDDDFYGPRTGLYRAIAGAFQDSPPRKKFLACAFPGQPPLRFNIGGACASLPELIGQL